MSPVLIVGGGISGLTAAYRLSMAGVPFRLFEQRFETGGLIGTDQIDGCTIERGPDSFVASKPWAMDLIRELGLGEQLIPSNDSRRATFVVRDRRLLPMPQGLRLIVPTQLEPILASPLFSDQCKQDLQGKWEQLPPPPPGGDESLADFTRRHFNEEWLQYLAEPLLAGVFGGDPELLSASAVFPKLCEWETVGGSLTTGLLSDVARAPGGPLFWSLRDGMATLTDALRNSAAASIEHGHVESVSGPPWQVKVNGVRHEASDVILACPAYEAARLLTGKESLSALLKQIPYTSAATLALGYDRDSIPHPLNGFGFLVPARERRNLAACTWVGVKWDHRTPPGKTVIRCFFGSAQRQQIVEPRDDQMIQQAREELRELMGIEAAPRFAKLARWPDSMPQYALGHTQRIAQIEALTAELPGLHITGNFYLGVGISDSVRRAQDTVNRILNYSRSCGFHAP